MGFIGEQHNRLNLISEDLKCESHLMLPSKIFDYTTSLAETTSSTSIT